MINFGKYKRDARGNVSIMFAGTSLLLVIGIAVGVDYTNMTKQQTVLQAQVDAAVLAAAAAEVDNKSPADNHKIREAAAKEVMIANGYDPSGGKYSINDKSGIVEISASRSYTPLFAGILGVEKLDLSATAASPIPNETKVDVVLVLDNTESMSVDGKMDALKTGATNLIETIEKSDSGTKIGLVPFARYVRVDKKLKKAAWIDIPAEFDHSRKYKKNKQTGGTCKDVPYTDTVDGVKKEKKKKKCTGATYEEVDAVQEYKARWNGCLGTRPFPHSEKDETYSVKIPGLLNVLPRGKHKGSPTLDKYSACPRQITPMTDNYKSLKKQIDGMWTTDNTYMPTGLIWGQRVLSPGEPFDNAIKKGETAPKQYLILMTDGHNTTEIKTDAASAMNLDTPPYIGSVNSDETAIEANKVTARMCTNIKAQGIQIYTIAFQVTDTNTKSILRKCASENSMALTADNNEALIKRFETLADSLNAEIRLMR